MGKETKIAIYIRLSMADEDTGLTKDESDSIGNQRMLINRFLDEHSELSKYPRFEFADDGYTGTNFRRPRFTEMMEKVRAGEIDLICVKDFSRFSRDYIETGNYLECVFPFLGVRFISINDGYDSEDYKGTTGGIEVVMRSIIYAAYSKDLSIKTTTAKIQMMKQGKFVGGYAPYGYMMHPTQRNKLAIDPDSASVVRRIFDEALAGRNTSEIAERLNDDKIPTPGQYFKSKYPGNKKFSRMSEKISWTATMVYKALENYVYTGATVGHMRKSAGVGNRKTIAQDREDWIIVDGMHEAIVTKEEFEAAGRVIRKLAKSPERQIKNYPLRGLIYCPNCKRVMSRLKRKNGSSYYTCSRSVHDKDTDCAVREKYEESELERIVYNAIGQYVSLAHKQAVQDRKVGKVRKSAIDECVAHIRALQSQIEQLKSAKLRWYEKYTSGSIKKAEYLKAKEETDAKIREIDEALQKAHDRMKQLDSEASCSDDRLATVCEEYTKSEKLTYELTHAFIKAVYVYPDSRIDLEWKFSDFLSDEGGIQEQTGVRGL